MEPQHFSQALEEAAKREQQRLAEAAIETQIKVLSATYDKSAAYTNLIILAAYAGFFGLWQLTKDYLSKPMALWSALLMLISVVMFVFVEVVKMVLIQHNFMQKAKVLKLPEVKQNPDALAKAYAELGTVHERVLFHFMRFWVAALLVIIVSGMSAASILGYAFISGLAR